jgi:hypothetical protein
MQEVLRDFQLLCLETRRVSPDPTGPPRRPLVFLPPQEYHIVIGMMIDTDKGG